MGAYFYSYQTSAISILTSYKGQEPFAVFIKNYFRKVKKFGSRDRKAIADLCFGYLRIGQAGAGLTLEEQVLIGFLLTHEFDNGYLHTIGPDWLDYIADPVAVKLVRIQQEFPSFDLQSIFSFSAFLSEGINSIEFATHHLHKPSFFLRLRPGKTETVVSALKQSDIVFTLSGEYTLRVRGNVDIEKSVQLGVHCIVQDISSQQTANSLKMLPVAPVSIWDACAGSGGKSIMAADLYPWASLYVSDIREDILEELERRFELAKIVPSKIFCTDLEHSLSTQVAYSNLPPEGVDLIIADVPCSGSGTWVRSPEWLRIFDVELIAEYKKKQISIVSNLVKHLKPGGYFYYITCSVFSAENEEVVDHIQHVLGLRPIDIQLISGIETGGDHLYTALFTL